MSDVSRVRAVVSRFFQVPEAEIGEAFVFPRNRLQGSLARTTLRSAIKRLANVDLPAAMTALTFGDLVADIGDTNAPGGNAARPVGPPASTVSVTSPAGANGPSTARAAPQLIVGLDVESAASLPWGGDPSVADAFYLENFTAAELAHVRGRPDPELSLLGLWAAKEAVLKCGWAGLLEPPHVEIVFGPEGQPRVAFASEARALASRAGRQPPEGGNYSVSISHATGVAAAVCVRLD